MIHSLKKIFESASDSDIVRVCHSQDASLIEGDCIAVVWPKSSEELRKLMILANQGKIPLCPRGSGTNSAGCIAPERSIIVDMTKMNRIETIYTREKKAIVEAGVTLKGLNAELERIGLCLPLEPLNKDSTQIGSMISTMTGMKQYLNWVEFVDGTGKIFNSRDFLCGAEGATGVITRAEVKLEEIKAVKSLSFFSSDEFSEMMSLAKRYNSFKSVLSILFIGKKISAYSKIEKSYNLLIEFSDDTGKTKDVKSKALKNSLLIGSFDEFPRIEEAGVDIGRFPQFNIYMEEEGIPFIADLAKGKVIACFPMEGKMERFYEVVKDIGRFRGPFGRRRQMPEELSKRIIAEKAKYDPRGILVRA